MENELKTVFAKEGIGGSSANSSKIRGNTLRMRRNLLTVVQRRENLGSEGLCSEAEHIHSANETTSLIEYPQHYSIRYPANSHSLTWYQHGLERRGIGKESERVQCPMYQSGLYMLTAESTHNTLCCEERLTASR